MRNPPALCLLLLALLLASPSRAGSPGESLTRTDMLSELRARRAALGEALGEGTAVLFAAPSTGLSDYRPSPSFYYLTGIEDAGAALVLRVERPKATRRARAARRLLDRLTDISSKLGQASARGRALARRGGSAARELSREAAAAGAQARELMGELEKVILAGRGPARITERLYLPRRNPGRERWVGPSLSAGKAAVKSTGCAEVRDIAGLFKDLSEELPQEGRLFLALRDKISERFQAALDRLMKQRADLSVREVSRSITQLRAVKSDEEVARIRTACRLTGIGIKECMRSCRKGMSEYELQAVLEYACRRGGAPRQAFPSIVGSGPNSVILHYRANRRTIEDGDLVLMDVGAEFLGYAADVTRTFPVSGRFTREQAKIYDIVLEAQAAGIAAVRPGATLGDVHRAAKAVISKAGHAKAFLHSTSHYVGLDVHDPGPGGPLVPGMVITVEPGIYLVDKALGVRIEDTVLVTEDGAEVLSAGAPKERKEIEALMKEKGLGNLPIR